METVLHFDCFQNGRSSSKERTKTSFRLSSFYGGLGSHHFCPSCRDKGKGDDVCVIEKQEDCYICLQFTPEQVKKLKAKKVQCKIKEGSISKELEDSLLGVDFSNSSSTSSSAANSSVSVVQPPSSDALQLILAKLDNMQGRLSSLEKASVPTSSTSTFTSSASSKEVVTAELSSDQEGDWDLVRDRHSSRYLQTEEDDFSSIHEGSEARSKRHGSPG